MIKDTYSKKKLASRWFYLLQQIFCYEFEKIEHDLGKKIGKKPKYFIKKNLEKIQSKKWGSWNICYY